MKRILTVLFTIYYLGPIAAQDRAVKWARAVQGDGSVVSAEDVVSDDAGNTYIAFEFSKGISFDPPDDTQTANSLSNSTDLAIARYDSVGALEWYRTIGVDGSTDISYGFGITPGNKLVLVGRFDGTMDFDPGPGDQSVTSNGVDIFILKLDTAANFISVDVIGGPSGEAPKSMAIDPTDGSVFVIGNFFSDTDFDPGVDVTLPTISDGLFIAKYSSTGDLVWHREFDVSIPVFSSIAVDNQSRVLFSSDFRETIQLDDEGLAVATSNGAADVVIAQYDVNGNYNWHYSMGGENNDRPGQITFDDDDNIYLAFNSFSDKIDPNPVSTDASDTVLVVGASDGFIQKYLSDGTLQWVHHMKSTNADGQVTASILQAHGDSLYIGGGIDNSANLDPDGTSQQFDLGADVKKIYIINFSRDREFSWVETYGGDGNSQFLSDLAIDPYGELLALGGYTGTTEGVFGAFSLPTDNGSAELFTFKRGDCIQNVVVDSTVCAASFDFGANTLTSSGQYVDTFTNFVGCDSTVTLNLTLLGYTITADEVISVDPYTFGTQTLSTNGTYTETFSSIGGCDSIVTIDFFRAVRYDEFWENAPAGPEVDDIVIMAEDLVSGNDFFGYPIKARRLIIEPGVTVEISPSAHSEVAESIENNGTLIVRSGAIFVLSDSVTFSGNDITVKRNTTYADGRYSFVGSPIQQSSTITGDDLGTDVYKYDETISYSTNDGLDRWVAAGSDELVPGRGYTQANQEEIVFTGIPNIGEVIYSGTYTSDDGTNEGFNLVSNPYTNALNVVDFLLGNPNIEGVVYFWDDNGSDTGRGSNSDYVVANEIGATNTTPAGGQDRFNGRIGSTQGFFVKLKDNTNTNITFNQAMGGVIANRDSEFFRTAEIPLVRINLTHADGLFKQTVLAWREDGSSNKLIRTYDAPVFNSDAEDLIYSVKADEELAIQVQPFQWEEVPLGVNVSISGSYELSMEGDEWVFLMDHETGEVTDLTRNTYSFRSEAGQFRNRFSLVANPNPILAVEQAEVQVYGFKDKIYVLQPKGERRTFRLFNLDGHLITTQSLTGRSQIDVTGLVEGVYLINDGEKTHKIFLK